MEDLDAFFEFLSYRNPRRSIAESTADDAVEFLLSLPSDRIEKVAGSLAAATFKGMDGNHKENPFGSSMVRTLLKECVKEDKESGKKKVSYQRLREIEEEQDNEKENILEKCLTDIDVGKLNRLVIAADDAGKHPPFGAVLGSNRRPLSFEDEDGKPWEINCSYVAESYVFTEGWGRYVREKQLGAGDFVFFQRHRTNNSKLFIGYRRRLDGYIALGNDVQEFYRTAVLNPTLLATFAETLELREKLKGVETHSELRLPEHTITGSDTILVIFCGDNQDSEETYFISCIVNDLCLRGFTPCRYDLTRSTVTGTLDMLSRSLACIMIISMNCARSRECLDEFVAIIDHLQANTVALLPVLFKVRRSSIETVALPSQVKKWRDAMNKLTALSRHQYMKGDEVMIAKTIVRDVCLLISSETCKNLIGVKLILESILPLLHCPQSSAPHIVGLWGMAGIGKTTITREIFRTKSERYDVCYFLPDFHLMCQTKGLSHLRDEFFSKIIGEEKVFIDACDTKLSFKKDRFLDKRVLIVLDGVSNARDAEVLVGGFGWLSGGHTVILTSRNRQVLVQCNAKEIYEIPKLSMYDSFCLLRQSQTGKNQKGRMTMVSKILNYASGIPLALRVLGLAVQKIRINNEKENLRRLQKRPPVEIQDAFRESFNGLHENEKNIFLDLACFFRGENKDHVVNILDGCGSFADLGIYALIDESLISLVDNRLEMPNIFQDTGKFVVSQENNEASKRSRLWDSTDIADVLINNSGTEAIEGIFLDASGLTFELSPTVFERMYRLRLLKLHCPISGSHCMICLPQGLDSLPDELRLLHWERYPLGSLPRNFNPKNLVELNMPCSNMTKLWKGTKNLQKLKRITLSHSLQLIKFPRLSKAINLEHIDLEGCTSLVKVNSSILHHHRLTFLSLKDCSHLRVMPTTVHLESLEVLNLSGCSELENLQDFSPNLKELYLAGTAIREMPSSIGDLTRLDTLDLENCTRLQHLPPGISSLKAMMTLKLSGCSDLRSLPILDALFLRDSQRLDTKLTLEEFVPLKHHSAIQESRLDGSDILLNSDNLRLRSDIHGSSFSRDVVEEFLPAFEYLSSDRIPQEIWPRVTIIPFPSSILHSLASRLYALVSLFLCNANLVNIPEELFCLASVMTLDLGGNSFSQIPKAIKELRKLHSLRLRHCKNLRSLPKLPRSLEVLNTHGCVSLESFPSGFQQFPRHYIFSNCFNLSPEVVREFIRKVQYSFESMTKENQLEHSNVPLFSICIPASAGRKSLVSYQAGSSVMIELTPSMRKTVSGFALSVVVEFWDNYRNAAGFGIKCICRKSKTDLSPTLERIFYCWAPKEAPTVRKDHMFVFGFAKMHPAEGIDHDFLADLVTFEFYPVDWQNRLLDNSCTVKRCGVYLRSAATCDGTHGLKRPSSVDPGQVSSMEHMAPPYKRCRLKRVIESVILSIRKRKREKSVSRTTNLAEVQLGSVSPWGNDKSFWGLPPVNIFPQRPDKPPCISYLRTGDCNFGNVCIYHHPIDREAPVSLRPVQLDSVSPWGNDKSFWGLPPVNIFPQRPGEPLCVSYSRRGDCKFRNVCKFDHPIDREAPALLRQVQLGSVSPWGNDKSFWGLSPGNVFPQRPGQLECSYYMRTGDCKFGNVCRFHHPIDREAPVSPRQEHVWLYDDLTYEELLELSSSGSPLMSQPSVKLVEKSTKKPRKLSVSELTQANSSKDAIPSEQTKEKALSQKELWKFGDC